MTVQVQVSISGLPVLLPIVLGLWGLNTWLWLKLRMLNKAQQAAKGEVDDRSCPTCEDRCDG